MFPRLMTGAALLALLAGAAQAQEARIGLAAEPTSADPHFHAQAINVALRWHVFDGLTATDKDLQPQPALAESWSLIDPTTWQFKLRPGVTFSNGTPFTARDVIYSFCRIPVVENSPGGFQWALKTVADVTAPDDLTVVIKTTAPDPILPTMLANVAIISAAAAGGSEKVTFAKPACTDLGANPAQAAFSDPAMAIGTGPFKYTEFRGGERVTMERNETYWGAPQYWQKLTFRSITNPGARVAALLAGDVDLIEAPPTQDFERIQSSGMVLGQALSTRSIYIGLDVHQGDGWVTPGVKGTDKNPLLDVRVRKALSMAINRQGLVDRIMGGAAQASGEFTAWPIVGSTENLPLPPYDAEGAKALLAEAGYPDGFDLVLGTSNDRYINDEKVFQAIAQMWTRIGVRTSVNSQSAATFFTQRKDFAFSAALGSWAASTGEAANYLFATFVTPDPKSGAGTVNFGRYSNPRFDALVAEAMQTMDRDARADLTRQAVQIVVAEDYAGLPLYVEKSAWAHRKGLVFTPRSDQYTVMVGGSDQK